MKRNFLFTCTFIAAAAFATAGLTAAKAALLTEITVTEQARIHKDFTEKQNIFKQGNLFKIFDTKMTDEERNAMEFLYAYMSTGDLTDYTGEFYLQNVRSSLKARKETPWGSTVPDDIFMHFVLPVRANNEALDDSRRVFNKELMPRVKSLSMRDAILEVNHWCHEKVIYTPSDARTSSPLASVRTAYGRCGEESTLLVAALRSVGIPARQVYTPRWAHTDDNHAWVEAWADGRWHFLGACEPEPVLDLGWFNAPASRGMLMHTKVFGAYSGPEEVMTITPNYTEINVIGNYAKKAEATVRVTDAEGRPVKDARVEFKIYNYAEYFTVSVQTTGSDGTAKLSAGLGDMVVTATANGRLGIGKVSFGKDKTVSIKLSRTSGQPFETDIDIVPPHESPNIPKVTPEQRAENTRRMKTEDSIRNAYTSTFPSMAAAEAFAEANRLDKEKTATAIIKSRGNYAAIMSFLENAAKNGNGVRALDLLSTVSDKDLRDTPCAILEDHLLNTATDADVSEVLAPRVAGEMLTPYRSYLQRAIHKQLAEAFRDNPQVLIAWCKDSLTLRDDLNRYSVSQSPQGVWQSRVTDTRSRNVFFVAVCRSLGVRAWIDEVSGNMYYRDAESKPVLVRFDAVRNTNEEKGTLKAVYQPIARLDNPKYYTHFTISKYDNGTFRLLNYPEETTWESLLKNGALLETGCYMITTGSRMADGSVLSHASSFNIKKDETTTVSLVMRDNTDGVRVIGNFNSESVFTTEDGSLSSVLSATGRGYFVVGVLGCGEEPTNHALKDIEIKKADFEKWGRTLLLLFTDRASFSRFKRGEFPDLPSNTVFGVDADGSIRKEISEAMKSDDGGRLPLFIIGDTFNRVVFESEGYTIGLGEQLLNVIKQIEE